MMNDGTAVAARTPSILIGAVALALLPGVGQCAFMCKPPGGSMIILDHLPPECAGVEIRELNPDGSLKRIIPPPRTPEQMRAEEEKQKQSADCDKQNEAQKRDDEALIKRYPIEGDLIAARDHALANEKARLEPRNQRMSELKSAREQLENQKARYKGGPLPDALQTKVKANDSDIAAVEHQIEVLNSNMEQIAKRSDADLKRYRDLMNGTVTVPCSARNN
jgi:regulator of protease activity HflC (stomatin/prohibitin superfamily)